MKNTQPAYTGDSPHVDETVRFGDGVVVCGNVTIGFDSRIGSYAVIQDSAVIGESTTVREQVTIGEGARIGDNVSLRDGVTIGAEVTVGDNVLIDPATTVLTGASIGSYAVIADGWTISPYTFLDDHATVVDPDDLHVVELEEGVAAVHRVGGGRWVATHTDVFGSGAVVAEIDKISDDPHGNSLFDGLLAHLGSTATETDRAALNYLALRFARSQEQQTEWVCAASQPSESS